MEETQVAVRLEFLTNEALNLERDKRTWGRNENLWRSTYKYGYYWQSGINQKNNIVTPIAEKYPLPHLDGGRDLKVIELLRVVGVLHLNYFGYPEKCICRLQLSVHINL